MLSYFLPLILYFPDFSRSSFTPDSEPETLTLEIVLLDVDRWLRNTSNTIDNENAVVVETVSCLGHRQGCLGYPQGCTAFQYDNIDEVDAVRIVINCYHIVVDCCHILLMMALPSALVNGTKALNITPDVKYDMITIVSPWLHKYDYHCITMVTQVTHIWGRCPSYTTI